MLIGRFFHRMLRLPSADDYTAGLVKTGEIRTALDVGCGQKSPLSRFRPQIRTVGVDAFAPAVEAAKQAGLHDICLVADVMADGLDAALAANGNKKFDLVSLVDLIEHLPKHRGYDLLQQCEQLTGKFILLQTPNGFVAQGPEYGNDFQRHLSGWFPHEFEGLGYTVYGTTGTRYFLGYAGGYKSSARGIATADTVLGGLLRARTRPRHAFNLVAIKDVRGVRARLSRNA